MMYVHKTEKLLDGVFWEILMHIFSLSKTVFSQAMMKCQTKDKNDPQTLDSLTWQLTLAPDTVKLMFYNMR